MTKKNKRNITKKNKKVIIMITTGATFLVATSLAIGARIVHASSSSDIQDVKNAKIALKGLTTNQKTVDLTKDVNQKLPSEIAPTIKSIKALNALIKGVIIAPNGVTYTPDVVKIDNDKREFVVEIEITKGDVKDKFQFVVIGFTTVEDDVAKALARIDDDTIKGDKNKLSSIMNLASIEKLDGFPRETNGVHFSFVFKNPNDADGTLDITLTAIKKNASKDKDITISGFKISIQAQANQIDVKNALAKIDDDTIKGDKNKLPSNMLSSILIEKLNGFPKETNGVHFSAISKHATNVAGTLLITLKATKGKMKQEKELTISGFKMLAQSDQEDVKNALAKIDDDTIKGDKNKLPSQSKDNALIKALEGFPQIDSGVSFSVFGISDDDVASTLNIFLMASKGDANEMKKITISGFKKQQSDQDIVNSALVNIDNETISGDADKLPSQSRDEVLIKALEGFPKETNGVSFSVHVIGEDNIKGELTITLKATKGSAEQDKEVTISGFKTTVPVQNEINAAKAILHNHLYSLKKIRIKDGTKSAIEVTYAKWEDFIAKTTLDAPSEKDQAILNKVSIAISAKPKYLFAQWVTFTISKTNGKAKQSFVEVTGFRRYTESLEQANINAAKAVLNGFNTSINDNTQFAYKFKYDNLTDFIAKTALDAPSEKDQATLDKVTIIVSAVSKGATSQTVTFSIWSKKDPEFEDDITVEVTGFQSSEQAQVEVNAAQAILDKLDDTITTRNKFADKVTYFSWEKFFEKTALDAPSQVDRVALKKVSISITQLPLGSSSQRVIFEIKKQGVASVYSTIIVSGFKEK